MKITGAKCKYIGNGGMFAMIPVFFFLSCFFRTNHPIPPFFVFSTRKINVDDDDDDDIMGYNVTRPIFHWIMGVVMGE